MNPSRIVTQRLYLRQVFEGDAENLYHNYCSDSERSRFLTRPPHRKIEETSHFLTKWCQIAWEEKLPNFAWVIALKNTNEAIGIFLAMYEGEKVQIHYGISRNYEQQGFITEAGHEVVQWLKIQPEVKEIWTVCDLENYGSLRVLEKLGFKNQGVLKKWLNLPAFGNNARDCYKYKINCSCSQLP
ncbi:MAG: GNAT family N-acetyltransferase [Tatlockia sp.]|nr:GNAT family N-acetyltransferase [Tatlockia sp.]